MLRLPLKSPNDSLQDASTAYVPSSRGREHSSLDTSSFQTQNFVGGATMGGGSMQSYMMDHLARMHSDIESTTRRLELEQRRLFRLDKELESAESEFERKRKRDMEQQSAQSDAVQRKVFEVRQLEKRLEKTIAGLNQSSCENEALREQIDRLRKERKAIMNPVFKNLDRGIQSNMKQLDRIGLNINGEKSVYDDATLKSKALNKMVERERRNFHKVTDQVSKDLTDQSSIQREQDRGAQDRADASAAKGKKKRGYMVADEEEAFSEEKMHKRILKLSFLNAIQRRHIKQHQKNIEVFEQAFNTIKSSTGISDIEEIVKIFIGLEQRNFSLLTYVNTINREIESFETRNEQLKHQLKSNEEDKTLSGERKKAALHEISNQIARTQAATKEKDGLIAEAWGALEECRPLIWKVVSFLGREMPGIIRVAYEGDAPQMKAAPQDDQQENLGVYLMYIEDCLNQFRVCLDKDTRMQRPLPQPKDKNAAVKKPSDLPSAHNIAGDDSDDDPETGMGDRPLDRAELRDRAQQVIARRRRKPTQQVRTEERRQEVEDGVPVSTPRSTPRDADAGGLPTIKQATGGSGKPDGRRDAAPEEEGDRKDMWWRAQNRSK